MPFWAEQNQNYPPKSDDYGLFVRPIFSGSDAGILTVQLASGSNLTIGGISGSFTIPAPTSSSLDAVPRSNTVVTLAAANSNRKGLTIYNDSGAQLFVRLGPGASTSIFTVRLVSQAYYEIPFPVYTGEVTGIWASSGGGNGLVTELT